MKILLASEVDRDINGGTAGVLFELKKAFSALGHEADLFFGSDCIAPYLSHRARDLLFGLLLFFHLLARRAHGVRYDVIDISGGNAYLSWFMRVLRLCRIVVGRTHGGVAIEAASRHRVSLKHRIRRLIYGLQCAIGHRSIDLYVVPTYAHIDVIPSSLRKIASVVPYGLNERFRVPIAQREWTNLGVLYVGNWIEGKGIEPLTVAMCKLCDARSDFRFTVVGCDSPETVTQTFGQCDRVKVYSKVGQDELLEIYDDNHIFVFPSRSEGYGRVLVEAMSRGLCIVTTRVGVVSDIVKDGVNGVILHGYDDDAIYQAIRILLDDPAVVRRLSEAAHASSVKLTWEEAAQKTIAAYTAALQNRL